MPVPQSTRELLRLDGTPQYERYLLRLSKRVRATGSTLPEGHSALAEYALVILGVQHGLIAPRRLPYGSGGKRPGSGRPRKEKPP